MSDKSILLVQTPPWGFQAAPLGIAYISQYLRTNGFCVNVYDLNIEVYNKAQASLRQRWDTNQFEYWSMGGVLADNYIDINAVVDKILNFNSQIIGFSTSFTSIPLFNEIAKGVRSRSPNTTIIVGGAGPSYFVHRNFFNRDLVDYFVIGEGELIFYELIKKISQGNSSFIDNTCVQWKDSPEDHALCLRSKVAPVLDELPSPSFEEFDISDYTEDDLLPIITSRGCINSCNFCCDWSLKKPFRSRTPDMVFEEIKFLLTKYHRKRFEFCDLLLNGHLKNLERLCDLLIEAGSPIHWGGQATVRPDMTKEQFLKLKKAGCGGLTFGFESFSDPLLEKMNKKFKAKDAELAIRYAKDAGIIVEGNLIVGFPGEEEVDVERTIQFLKRNRKYIDRVNSLNICSIGPGMNVWEKPQDFGIKKDEVKDWYAWHTSDDSNTLDIRMRRHKKIKNYIEQEQFGLAWENIRKEERIVDKAQ